MGDMGKKTPVKTVRKERKSLEERTAEREARKSEVVHTENAALDYISGRKQTEESLLAPYQKSSTPAREKAISARVNGEIFEEFKAICKKKKMTTNAGLNMLIERFVKENS